MIRIPKTNPNFELSQNYQPISLLSSLSKIYEAVLLSRLNKFLDDNQVIISEQFGFRKQLSTNHQLIRVTELIQEGFGKSLSTGALFLDVAKAFDKIWHDGLLLKLIRLSFSPQLIEILNSGNFRVRVSNILYTQRPILSGCPQGSLLSPTLFNTYVNDIPKAPNCKLSKFADDTAIPTRNRPPSPGFKHYNIIYLNCSFGSLIGKLKLIPANVPASCLRTNTNSSAYPNPNL